MYRGYPRRSLIRGAWFFAMLLVVGLAAAAHRTLNVRDRYYDADGAAVTAAEAIASFERAHRDGRPVPRITAVPRVVEGPADAIVEPSPRGTVVVDNLYDGIVLYPAPKPAYEPRGLGFAFSVVLFCGLNGWWILHELRRQRLDQVDAPIGG